MAIECLQDLGRPIVDLPTDGISFVNYLERTIDSGRDGFVVGHGVDVQLHRQPDFNLVAGFPDAIQR